LLQVFDWHNKPVSQNRAGHGRRFPAKLPASEPVLWEGAPSARPPGREGGK
jgi:hypothetical protein